MLFKEVISEFGAKTFDICEEKNVAFLDEIAVWNSSWYFHRMK
jgi:hypothetical protein